MNIRESELPGIGCKFEITTNEDEKMVIVIHNDGRRELYHYDDDHEETLSSVTLNDSESRKIAAILGGMVYSPKALEKLEMAFDGLVIEWFKVEDGATMSGRTIGELDVRNHYNVNIISVLKKDMKKMIMPGPDSIISAGDTLVIAGERPEVIRFENELLKKKGDT
ncbi:cation:proton antiporter regulatory subunit [Bacillus sp. AGMB 02131]|uniref:Cation:proton antiporter regulatory subunit n=1 Tax=Peribacillus faecalis TaxID=2772559 RepID=A0A927HAH2_9BACI|nr:cation:proton antiporter regulatory subunit [Peribacillus faecalis]MBD3107451.1 cation:proton antiporter regulatory subunit [Peribacillus faecalis]